MVVVRVCVRRAARAPRAQHAGADDDHEQPRGEVQPRVELLGQHERRQRERDEAERNTPAVWVTVTVAPSAAAWRAVPRVPTR